MEEFARDVLIECIKNGDIGATQKTLRMMEERGLEVMVKKQQEISKTA